VSGRPISGSESGDGDGGGGGDGELGKVGVVADGMVLGASVWLLVCCAETVAVANASASVPASKIWTFIPVSLVQRAGQSLI
jgi:hypothetical protein